MSEPALTDAEIRRLLADYDATSAAFETNFDEDAACAAFVVADDAMTEHKEDFARLALARGEEIAELRRLAGEVAAKHAAWEAAIPALNDGTFYPDYIEALSALRTYLETTP